MALFDVQHPFFKPVWRRVAVVVFCFGWALMEWFQANGFWAIVFGSIGVFCAYEFFVVFDPDKSDRSDPPDT